MKDMTVRIGDSIKKINKPSKALCSPCNVVTYEGRGNLISKDHIITEAHVRIVETKRDNYELGSFTEKRISFSLQKD